MTAVKIVVEQHADGFIAYPLGVKGVVAGRGDSFDEALSDVQSAIRFHVDTFGPASFESETPVLSHRLGPA